MARKHWIYALPGYMLLLLLAIGFLDLPVTVQAGSPDLTIDSIWLEDASQPGQLPSQVLPGESFNIVATIKNLGQDTASSYYLDVYYDGDYGRGGPDNIAPGEAQTWYVGPLTAQAGTHTTKWVIDPDNQIAELNEANNQKELAFAVGSQTVTTSMTSSVTSSTSTSSTESTGTTTTAVTSSSSGSSTTTTPLSYTTQSTSASASSTESTSSVSQTSTGLESSVVLMLGMDGTDGSTSFPDSSSSNHVITPNGNAQVDAAQSKFGGASGLFDGNGDYLSSPDSADWYFGSSDFTIDFWVRFNALPTAGNYMMLYSQRSDDSNGVYFHLRNVSGTQYWWFIAYSGGSAMINLSFATALSTNTWYHVAMVRSGSNFLCFQNGAQIGSTKTDSDAVPDYAGPVYIGAANDWVGYFNGWIDELRISKGIARWTGNFTPPLISQIPITTTTTTVTVTSSSTTYTTDSTSTIQSFTTQSTSTAIRYTVTVFARKADSLALGGAQVTFGTETKTTDSSGKAEFPVTAGTYSLGVQSSLNGGTGIQCVFVQWVDGASANPRSVTVDTPLTYEARYKTQYQLTMRVDPPNSAGTSPGVGVWWYDAGQTVTIQASPASGYVFRSWAGSGSGSYTGTANPASVKMDEPASETATLASSPIITGRIVSVSDNPDPVARRRTAAFSGTIMNTGNVIWASATITIRIYSPDGALVATPGVTVNGVEPGGQYAYKISWRVPYNAPRGVWHYEVCLNYAGVLIASSADPANTIRVR